MRKDKQIDRGHIISRARSPCLLVSLSFSCHLLARRSFSVKEEQMNVAPDYELYESIFVDCKDCEFTNCCVAPYISYSEANTTPPFIFFPYSIFSLFSYLLSCTHKMNVNAAKYTMWNDDNNNVINIKCGATLFSTVCDLIPSLYFFSLCFSHFFFISFHICIFIFISVLWILYLCHLSILPQSFSFIRSTFVQCFDARCAS